MPASIRRGVSLPSMPVPRVMRPAKFDRLFAEGRAALLSGTHQVESVPVDGSPRWGIGAALRPDPAAAQIIEQIAVSAAVMVGDHRWVAGAVPSSHLTLRAGLECYRASVPANDPLVARYAAALRVAVSKAGPIRFSVTGLTLTPISVMASAVPADTAADELASAFGAALSADGLPRAGFTPDIWYVNLVYFTGPVRHAKQLTHWVAARREMKLADALIADAQIIRWRHTSTGMLPVVLASAVPSQSLTAGHGDPVQLL
jgi:hypothetical protein